MTRDQLNKLYNEFYGTNHRNAVLTDQKKVRCKKSKSPVLFLDEFSRAPKDLHNACLQLVLERKLHSHILPYVNGARTMIIAADNPDDGNYSVESLDPAVSDRFLAIDVEVDVQGWLDWARKNKVNDIVRAFIADNPSKLYFQPDEGNDSNIGATPRSWAKLGKFIDSFDNISPDLHYSIINGKVGKSIGLQFYNFYENYQSIISVQDVEDLITKLYKKELTLEKIGSGVNELIKDSEVIQQTELTKSVIQKYIGSKPDTLDSTILLGMLYGLNTEILSSVLKGLGSSDETVFFKITKLDEVMNNKKLFLKLVQNIEI